MSFRPTRLTVIAVAAVALCAAAAWALAGGERARPELGLFTTLPIYWGETAGLADMIDGETHRGWVRDALEERFELVPLDTLAPPEGSPNRGLTDIDHLLLAQPRALSPRENVALDTWVREGGHALIFADPMLTAHSRFGIGDRRRPQDVVLLSPILARWGLEMRFDFDQPGGERTIGTGSAPLPVNLHGTLHPIEGFTTGGERCRIAHERVFAQCSIGRGAATVIADAAVLEETGEDSRVKALAWLTDTAFTLDR